MQEILYGDVLKWRKCKFIAFKVSDGDVNIVAVSEMSKSFGSCYISYFESNDDAAMQWNSNNPSYTIHVLVV
jgi:hypothetical protein